MTSLIILKEVADVISRARIVKLTRMTEAERIDFIDKLIQRSDITEDKQLSQIVSRDVKDDKFLACGVEGKADYIISGDHDLLLLRKFEGIRIITPQEFVAILENGQK